MIHRCSGGAPERNTTRKVDTIDESEPSPLDAFIAGYVGFYFSHDSSGDDEHFALLPPPTDGPP